jgi:hypothetical protein
MVSTVLIPQFASEDFSEHLFFFQSDLTSPISTRNLPNHLHRVCFINEMVLNNNQRLSIVGMLLGKRNSNGEFPHGALQEVAKIWGVARSMIQRLWQKAESARVRGEVVEEEIFTKKHECGLPVS